MRYLRGNKGTSVVEILVVIVVLLVGILTVVRIFPPGFIAVRRAESMTIAGRLAQYEIERWKNNASNLPDGMLPIDGSGNVLNDLFLGPTVTDDAAVSTRRVIGETTRIPFGGWSTGPESGSLYVLAFAPIDTSGQGIIVRGGDLSRKVYNDDDGLTPWVTLRPYEYIIDYESQRIAFPPSNEHRTFIIACSWWESVGNNPPAYRTATNIQVDVAAGFAGWNAIVLPSVGGDVTFDNYSDTVSRAFRDVTGVGWSNDPYEFQVINPTLGIIAFNPLGYATKELGKALEARIDYDILDLQIIRDEKRIPDTPTEGTTYRVNLTLNRIKETGTTPDYDGIRPPLITGDIVVIDLQTAQEIDMGSASGIEVDYKNGTVTFPQNVTLSGGVVVPSAGRNVRFFYKAEDDWSLQLHKAYSMYSRNDSGDPLDYRSYAVVVTDNGSEKTCRIWFSACNANNTIAVTYDYQDGGKVRKVVGECYRTTDALEEYGGVDSTYITLKHVPERIYSVNGVSVRARVLWRDSERWRHVDVDTNLVRKPAD